MVVYRGVCQSEAELVKNDANWHRQRRCQNVAGRLGRFWLSTTLDFAIAQLFALRRSPIEVLHDESVAGVILEFILSGKQQVDWIHHRDYRCLQDEKEIAVLNPKKLRLAAVWKLAGGEYRRHQA